MIIDRIEYETSSYLGERAIKEKQEYCGIERRLSDDLHCLSIRRPGGARKHNIHVSSVISITLHGRTTILDTPPQRWRIRAEELRMILEGRYSGDWANAYFDPSSPKYYRRDSEYTGPHEVGSEGFSALSRFEAQTRTSKFLRPHEQPKGLWDWIVRFWRG